MNVQIAVLQIQRHLQSFALNCRQKRCVDVEINRIAKLVTLAGGGCFDAGRKISRVVTTRSALAEAAEEVSQSFVAQEVETFFGDFEMDVPWQWFGDFAVAAVALLLLGWLWLLAES